MNPPCFYNASPGTATSGVVSSGPCRLMKGLVTSESASVRFLQFFEASSVPADTAVPKISIPLDAGSAGAPYREYLAAWIPPEGLYFDGGLVWAISASRTTLDSTGVTAAEHSATIIGGNR